VPRHVGAELAVAVREGVAFDRSQEGLVDLLVGHVVMFALAATDYVIRLA
jgi:hypothetical protein